MSGPKQRIYESEVEPVLRQLVDICERRGLAMVATIELDAGDAPELPARATATCGVDVRDPASERLKQVARMLLGRAGMTMPVGARPGIRRVR